MSYFEFESYERVGILEGEYALILEGSILVTRRGAVFSAVSDSNDVGSSQLINRTCASASFASAIENILEVWDRLPVVESPALLSDLYLTNYFHFSLEMVPRIRQFPTASKGKLVVGASAVQRPFQTSLLSRAGADCGFIPAPQALRVRNPIVAHDFMSEDGVRWLRQVGPRARRGRRLIYIRRGSHSTRSGSGGGLEETAEFLSLLQALNFETIEFGAGKTVEEQVAMLDGAKLIIAAHGAALTNIAYLEEGVSLIEIIGARTPRAMFMHLCVMIGLKYSGILTDRYTESQNVSVDATELRELISDMG